MARRCSRHLITTLGVGQDVKNFFTTYNGMLHPDAMLGGWERYQNKDINNDILISLRLWGRRRRPHPRYAGKLHRRMEKGVGGPAYRAPVLCPARILRSWTERVSGNKRLPVWEGELYFEYHRGTYTSMARNKRANRKAELAHDGPGAAERVGCGPGVALPGGRAGRHVESHPAQSVPRYSSRLLHS